MSTDETYEYEFRPPQPPPADPAAVLRRNDTVDWLALGDGEIVVHHGQKRHSYVLSPLAALVWQCLDGESSLEEILTDVAETFEVDQSQVLDDFLPVVGFWVERSLVTPVPEESSAEVAEEVHAAPAPWRWLETPPNQCGKAVVARWDHHMVIGIGGAAITVACDRPEVIEQLEPWRIDFDFGLVDFVLELDQPRAVGHRFLRRLPTLSHGCEPLFRLRDESALLEVFWRSLASFAAPEPGEIRVRMMPVIRDGQALLLPPEHGGAISVHAYAAQSILPLYTIASVIDVESWTVRVDPPLIAGATAAPEAAQSYPITAWWLPTENPAAGLTPGEAVAYVVRWSSRSSEEDPRARLRLVARAVERQLPELAPVPPSGPLEQLSTPHATVLRNELMAAIVDRFEV